MPAAFTVMQLVIAPVLHRYVLPVTAPTQSWVEAPWQIVPLPVIEHKGVAETILLHVLLHPDALVTVTE